MFVNKLVPTIALYQVALAVALKTMHITPDDFKDSEIFLNELETDLLHLQRSFTRAALTADASTVSLSAPNVTNTIKPDLPRVRLGSWRGSRRAAPASAKASPTQLQVECNEVCKKCSEACTGTPLAKFDFKRKQPWFDIKKCSADGIFF